MPTQMMMMDRSRDKTSRTLRIGEVSVWRAANQMLKQYPETSRLVATQRADSAYATGQMLNFRFWAGVAQALTELLRQRSSDDTVN